MKHVIVIETPDDKPVSGRVRTILMGNVSKIFADNGIVCVVHSRFAAESAIAAVHEMFNAPE